MQIQQKAYRIARQKENDKKSIHQQCGAHLQQHNGHWMSPNLTAVADNVQPYIYANKLYLESPPLIVVRIPLIFTIVWHFQPGFFLICVLHPYPSIRTLTFFTRVPPGTFLIHSISITVCLHFLSTIQDRMLTRRDHAMRSIGTLWIGRPVHGSKTAGTMARDTHMSYRAPSNKWTAHLTTPPIPVR